MMVNLIQTYGLPERLDEVSPESVDFFADLSYSVGEDSPGGLYDMYYAAAYGLTAGTTRADGTRIADAHGKLTREQASTMMCYLADSPERYAGISGWAKSYVARASSEDSFRSSPFKMEYMAKKSALIPDPFRG